MAIQTLSYLDIPQKQRRASAATVISKLKDGLKDPALSADASKKLAERLAHVQKWVSGSLTPATPTLPEEGV